LNDLIGTVSHARDDVKAAEKKMLTRYAKIRAEMNNFLVVP